MTRRRGGRKSYQCHAQHWIAIKTAWHLAVDRRRSPRWGRSGLLPLSAERGSVPWTVAPIALDDAAVAGARRVWQVAYAGLMPQYLDSLDPAAFAEAGVSGSPSSAGVGHWLARDGTASSASPPPVRSGRGRAHPRRLTRSTCWLAATAPVSATRCWSTPSAAARRASGSSRATAARRPSPSPRVRRRRPQAGAGHQPGRGRMSRGQVAQS